MTLEDVIMMDTPNGKLVKDYTKIFVTQQFRTYGAHLHRKGNWYEDQILDLMDKEIEKVEFEAGMNSLTVTLKA